MLYVPTRIAAIGFALLGAFAGGARSQGSALTPAASPIVCTPVQGMHPVDAAVFQRSRDAVGDVSKHPSSVHPYNLNDARPYGEAAERVVEVAVFDAVPVRSPDEWQSSRVRLSLAFDDESGALVCAFTEPKSVWVASKTDPASLEGRAVTAGWHTGPAHGDLTSKLTEVLEALWRRFGIDPAKAGQVVIRPRFVTNDYPAEGKLGPRYPPANVWVVEVLGTVVGEKTDHDEKRVFTTLVAQFRDGDLESLPSMMLP
jgi:hypothetical protein